MSLTRSSISLLLVALIAAAAVGPQVRRVDGDTLVSDLLSKISVKIDKTFKYVGRFDFKIREVAAGERFVFVDADRSKKVRRLFIAQFEGSLPGIVHKYNYNFDNAETMGGHKFRQNTYAYSNAANAKENPQNEGVLTANFLSEKGYRFEDEFMMSRFLTVPDVEC